MLGIWLQEGLSLHTLPRALTGHNRDATSRAWRVRLSWVPQQKACTVLT